MSSFVIDRESYIRAAGLIGAMCDHKNRYNEPALRIWNKRECRCFTSQDVKADFERLYTVNAKAVAEQYGDPEPARDERDLSAVFNPALRLGNELMRKGYRPEDIESRKVLKTQIYKLIDFFRSALYQIEGESYEKTALRILNKYYRGLYAVLLKLDSVSEEDAESWGSFEF